MDNVVSLVPAPLRPFLGGWVRDPLSVSRNKVVKKRLGQEALQRLWSLGSIGEVRACLAAEPEFAARYDALLALSSEGRLTVGPRQLIWSRSATRFIPAETRTSYITRVTVEGRKVIVAIADGGTVAGYEFRKKAEWLLVSERYTPANARIFPRSPVHRYYRADAPESG